jgi:hypothetical protein
MSIRSLGLLAKLSVPALSLITRGLRYEHFEQLEQSVRHMQRMRIRLRDDERESDSQL